MCNKFYNKQKQEAHLSQDSQPYWLSVTFKVVHSSKVDDFYVIWKLICDFLSMINSDLSLIAHRLATLARNGLQGHPRSMIFT